jgi:hypothetical protein
MKRDLRLVAEASPAGFRAARRLADVIGAVARLRSPLALHDEGEARAAAVVCFPGGSYFNT